MTQLLKASDVQELLKVDRSTVYRMAEDGRLPAVKVGKQWRFPTESLQEWLGPQVEISSAPAEQRKSSAPAAMFEDERPELADLLPLECIQLIQDSHAELLGVMMVVTDLNGTPVTRPSNPCGLFEAVSKEPDAIQRCISTWHDLGQSLNLEPTFQKSHLGLLCTRGLIRVGTELRGMVVAGCVAPHDWPPSAEETVVIADAFGLSHVLVQQRLDQVYFLDDDQRDNVLMSVQRVANIVAHIIQERQGLLGRLDVIANLARL